MDDIKLPDLPIGILFDRDFAQEYARDAVLADRERRPVVKESLTPEREHVAFINWASDPDPMFDLDHRGPWNFANHVTQSAWEAWQARAALAKGE